MMNGGARRDGGRGRGLGKDGRGRSGAAGLSSSMGARCCVWEGCHCLWGILVIHVCVGVVIHGWGLFSVPGHCWLWALGGHFCLWAMVIICGCWASFMGARSLSVGAGSMFMGPGLSIVGGGARSHGWVVCGCWLVICGHGDDMLCAGWSLLARLDGMRVEVLTKQQR